MWSFCCDPPDPLLLIVFSGLWFIQRNHTHECRIWFSTESNLSAELLRAWSSGVLFQWAVMGRLWCWVEKSQRFSWWVFWGSRFVYSKHILPGHSGTVPQELRLGVIFLVSQKHWQFYTHKNKPSFEEMTEKQCLLHSLNLALKGWRGTSALV